MSNLTEQEKALVRWLFGRHHWCPKCRAGESMPHEHERDDGKEYKFNVPIRSAKQTSQSGKKSRKSKINTKQPDQNDTLTSGAEKNDNLL